ncbi:uroporphyrinogen-III C-methyltransferase [Ferroplasma sp.]|uniref:uroporphyrinogen-III C-methyltransferase n=1 Tax=Ferroplasma sp. TaxID=2591003 RepID=UPI00307D3B3E
MVKVFIVGCGPGNMDFLTVKAVKIIKEADSIIYDHLINPEILDYARPGCRKIYVGKKPYARRISQEEINKIIVEEALKNNIVARLKGGDPFLFGRGGEEVEELINNNIEYEVIPGVSSLIAVPEAAGIPVTHRNVNHGIIATTGNNVENMNIPECRNFNCRMYTLVIFMGAHNLYAIREKLISAGYDPLLPVAIIENGTYNHQKTFTGTLESINYDYAGSPSLIVIGDVAKYHEMFCKYENKPYSGKIVTVLYDLYFPDTAQLESMGLTVYKIRSAEVFPGNISTATLYGKNIAFEGRFAGILMDIFRSSGFDLRWLGKIATDNTGRQLLLNYGIFDLLDISSIDDSYIRIGTGNEKELQVARMVPIKIGNYINDYIEKSDLIVIASMSGSLPDGINIPEKAGVIKIEYPYNGFYNEIRDYFGDSREKN